MIYNVYINFKMIVKKYQENLSLNLCYFNEQTKLNNAIIDEIKYGHIFKNCFPEYHLDI